ncbi:protein phosphatase 1 regulatory subunit 37-like, partial [Passer montanus]|uniref:protein phosphatase 1 regulatory subunit 37-like n=1 Tax=Passer montanus TaxID=9160 RepID=UPI001961BA39
EKLDYRACEAMEEIFKRLQFKLLDLEQTSLDEDGLGLSHNHLMDSGLAYICEGLREQRRGLVTLVLWNNQLSHAGMAYLGMTLPHTQSLETLNLGHNAVGNEGVRNLKNGLIGNRSVLRLGLACTKLTCEGAVAVAEFVAESPRLLRLDLRENDIKTGGLMALSLALRVNHSLLRLDLDREPKKEAVRPDIPRKITGIPKKFWEFPKIPAVLGRSRSGKWCEVFGVEGRAQEGAVPVGSGAVPELRPRRAGASEGIPCGSPSRDSPLPNGLKADFARALPEPGPEGDGKSGTCAAEH